MSGLSRLAVARRLPALVVTLLLAGVWACPPVQSTITAVPRPLAIDFQQVGAALTPPSEAQCVAQGRRCFAPAALQNAYNLSALYAAGNQGQGITVAVVDSFGSNTIRTDLNNSSTQFGLPHMCGEANYTCAAGDPTFDILCVQALHGHEITAADREQRGQRGPERLDRRGLLRRRMGCTPWHRRANVLLVTAPTAETLGVQGLPQMMNAEQYVIDNGLAQVITQSFGAAERTFDNGTAAIEQPPSGAFKSALATTSRSSRRRATSADHKCGQGLRQAAPMPTPSSRTRA